ncbi:CopG family transcriptional regulator [Streptococcus mitis]|uniref:CopG family transcriptional regulator n=1 Tax=Streptococcus mitis TaxID=28037 RepID=UPI0011563DA5|nr:CopG family transcriptional regulator [Streptococcus mitis]
MKTQTKEKKRLTISLAQEVYNKLEEDAMQRGLNKSSYLTTLIQNFKEERA